MQSLFTPRSKTITGTPLSQAVSTAGVNVAVVDGEMMMASQSPESTNAWMSEICWLSSSAASEEEKPPIRPSSISASACWRMVMEPVTRQGLDTEALEKQTWAFSGSSMANSAVSIHSGSIAWAQGSSSGASGVISRWASCASNSAWSNHSASGVVAAPFSPPAPSAPSGASVVQAVSSRVRPAAPARNAGGRRMGVTSGKGRAVDRSGGPAAVSRASAVFGRHGARRRPRPR